MPHFTPEPVLLLQDPSWSLLLSNVANTASQTRISEFLKSSVEALSHLLDKALFSSQPVFPPILRHCFLQIASCAESLESLDAIMTAIEAAELVVIGYLITDRLTFYSPFLKAFLTV